MAKKVFEGTVVSDKMNKTIVVEVKRKVRHRKYGKLIIKSKKYYAHDEKNEKKEGDLVTICETRPLSKMKRWRVLKK